MQRDKFEELVAKAVDALPSELQERLENVDIVVEDHPSRSQLSKAEIASGYTLMGLYEGVPLTERDSRYGLVPPDKITIFQKAIEAESGPDERRIQKKIARVVLHEIAHHFGISDDRLREIGRY